jgi:hypothetical protein
MKDEAIESDHDSNKGKVRCPYCILWYHYFLVEKGKNLENRWSLGSINHNKITWKLQTQSDC